MQMPTSIKILMTYPKNKKREESYSKMGAKPYSVVRGFVNARINLSEVPEFQHPKGARESNWHDGAGLAIFETM